MVRGALVQQRAAWVSVPLAHRANRKKTHTQPLPRCALVLRCIRNRKFKQVFACDQCVGCGNSLCTTQTRRFRCNRPRDFIDFDKTPNIIFNIFCCAQQETRKTLIATIQKQTKIHKSKCAHLDLSITRHLIYEIQNTKTAKNEHFFSSPICTVHRSLIENRYLSCASCGVSLF